MADVIRHPLQTFYSLKKDPWRVVRVLVCVGIFVGFAFWDVKIFNDAPVSDWMVRQDNSVLLFSAWHDKMDKMHNRIPDISSQILAVQYVAVIALLLIFVSRGDFILVAILISWGLGLMITLITQLPVAASSLRYYRGAWFPLEQFVQDYTVSWHAMMLTHCFKAITRVCPFPLLYALAVVVSVLVTTYLLATRNTCFIALWLGVSCAIAGLWVASQIPEWIPWCKDSATLEEKQQLMSTPASDAVAEPPSVQQLVRHDDDDEVKLELDAL